MVSLTRLLAIIENIALLVWSFQGPDFYVRAVCLTHFLYWVVTETIVRTKKGAEEDLSKDGGTSFMVILSHFMVYSVSILVSFFGIGFGNLLNDYISVPPSLFPWLLLLSIEGFLVFLFYSTLY